MFTISEGRAYRTKGHDININDVRGIIRALNNIEKGLRAELMREAKAPAKRLDQTVIKPAIRRIQPLSGFKRGNGRLSWDHTANAKGGHVAIDKTQVQFRTSGSKTSTTTSLVSVKVLNPAVIITDIAGRSGRAVGKGYKGTGFTRPYQRNGKTIRHRINGQGRAMIQRLGGHASRYLWPAVMTMQPVVAAEIQQIVDKYERIAQRGLK